MVNPISLTGSSRGTSRPKNGKNYLSTLLWPILSTWMSLSITSPLRQMPWLLCAWWTAATHRPAAPRLCPRSRYRAPRLPISPSPGSNLTLSRTSRRSSRYPVVPFHLWRLSLLPFFARVKHSLHLLYWRQSSLKTDVIQTKPGRNCPALRHAR
jgi:hypothetical protein